MRGSLLDFTRGSQVAETVGMMFGTALRPMFWTVVAILAAAIGYQLWQHTEAGDSYYWMMHSYASVWHYFEFNPAHLIGLKMVAGDTVRVPISLINSYPALIDAWARLTTALTRGGVIGLVFGVPVSIMATIALRRFGHDLTERKHTRGAMIANTPELIAEVDSLNTAQSAKDRRDAAARLYGRSAPLKLLKASARAEVEALVHVPYTVGGVPYPWRAEQSHTMIVGTTGTGKSTAMKDLLRQIKLRGDRAVVFDLTGTYVEGFYNPRTDVLLNPFDSRCPAWSPFADAHTREHFKEVSQALIPVADSGGDSFWQETARMLFVETCVRLVEQGRGNNKALAEVLMTSKLKDLHAHVARTIAAPLTDPEAKRMAESIRATFNTYAQALMVLPDQGAVFSIRDWVLGIDPDGRNGVDDGIDVLAAITPAEQAEARAREDEAAVELADTSSNTAVVYDVATGEIIDDDDGVPSEASGSDKCEEDQIATDQNESQALPDTVPGSVLFVAAQHVNLRSVRVLLTMWITTAINTLMSMRGDQRDIRLWFLIDEIGALHNIPAIVAGMQTSRNYGGAFVLGVHTMAQLRETYGDNNAETISSLAKTKLLMNTRDRGTQDWESEQIGEGEWTELEENWSYGVDNVRDAATLQRKIKLEPLVLPTEFGELPDLHGYLKFPQGLPAARVKLTYVKYRRRAPGFIERVIAPLQLPGFDNDVPVDTEAATTSAPTPAKTHPGAESKPVAVPGNTDTGDGSSHGSSDDPNATTTPVDATGEGYQTAVASEPPERLPTDFTKIIALPPATASDSLPAMLASLNRLSADLGGNAASGDPSAQRDQADSERGENAGPRAAAAIRDQTPSLGMTELALNFSARDRARHHRDAEVKGVAFVAAGRRAAEQSTAADIAELNVGRDHDDEYSR
ncbi:MAG: type IV secretion system DNA-binding domain-containing protein [Janthinobacterium lividum]